MANAAPKPSECQSVLRKSTLLDIWPSVVQMAFFILKSGQFLKSPCKSSSNLADSSTKIIYIQSLQA